MGQTLRHIPRRRRGSSTIDYVLVMGIVLPMATFVFWIAPQMMQQVYAMFCLFFATPFL